METKLQSKINKNLYKLFLGLTKYTPVTLALTFVISTFCNYIQNPIFIFDYIFGTSIAFLIILYFISLVFLFCYIYKIPLYYITIIHIISFTDYLFNIPISDLWMYRIFTLLTGIAILVYIYLEYKSRLRKN